MTRSSSVCGPGLVTSACDVVAPFARTSVAVSDTVDEPFDGDVGWPTQGPSTVALYEPPGRARSRCRVSGSRSRARCVDPRAARPSRLHIGEAGKVSAVDVAKRRAERPHDAEVALTVHAAREVACTRPQPGGLRTAAIDEGRPARVDPVIHLTTAASSHR